MSQPQPESPQTEINPWESTVAGETYVDTRPNPLKPSAWLLWTSIAISVAVKGYIIWLSISSRPNFTLKLLSYGVPELAMAVMMGMGLAMLVHVIYRQKFSQMMPGHWRLILFALTLLHETVAYFIGWVAGLWWFMPSGFSIQAITLSTLLAVFCVTILWTTSEGPAWRTYAVLRILFEVLLISEVVIGLSGTHSILRAMNHTAASWELAVLFLQLAIVIVLFVAVILDWLRKIPRDVNHYVGVYLVMIVPFLAGFIDRFVEELLTLNSV